MRTLTRTIARVVRKAAVEMLENDVKSVTVTRDKVTEYLGAVRYLRDLPEKKPRVGVVNGLAYTTVGGETLAVECAVMAGGGGLKLTGQLGDVMKESAQAALSWIRAHAAEFDLAPDFYKTIDIHIHVPEGAVPKDGPSAGRDHGHGADQRHHGPCRAAGCGHDGRNHPARARTAHRRG